MTDNDQAGRNSHDHSKCGHNHDATASGKPGEMAVDPVCGMTVDLGAGKPTSRWGGTQYHFCSARCHDRFVADPYFYVSGNNKKKRPAAKKNALYTCPMDPEIVRRLSVQSPLDRQATLEDSSVPLPPEYRNTDSEGRVLGPDAGKATGSSKVIEMPENPCNSIRP